jgi:uncharacterized protein YlxP (DUF503 family)
MIVGIAKLFIFISSTNSLKEKRMVLRSLKDRLRNNFNISVMELDYQDKWQRSTLAFAAIGRDKSSLSSLISTVINFVEQNKQIQLLDYETELL